MKTVKRIIGYVAERELSHVKAGCDAIKNGDNDAARKLYDRAVECDYVLRNIHKIVDERKRETRNTIVVAILGAAVAVLALYLMF